MINQAGLLRVDRVQGDSLPEGFDALQADARVDGVRNMDLLAEQWASGEQRFDGPGEALFVAALGGRLAGVGGVTRETGQEAPAMRMRRLYVRRGDRRRGVGRALALAMIARGCESEPVLTVNAAASATAGPFWESLGFSTCDSLGATHLLTTP